MKEGFYIIKIAGQWVALNELQFEKYLIYGIIK
jgi:hypothetical protein